LGLKVPTSARPDDHARDRRDPISEWTSDDGNWSHNLESLDSDMLERTS